MWNAGLTAAQTGYYHKALASSHTVYMRVSIIDLEHRPVQTVTDRVMDGSVTVDYYADEATRSLDLVLLDVNRDLGFDTTDVVDGVWFFDRMVQVWAEVFVPELGRYVEAPIFTGPVRKFKRRGPLVTFKCVGKDVFARQSWPRFSIPKGTERVEAIRRVLRELGETKFRFEASSGAQLASDKTIDRNMELSPWGWCRSIAGGMGMRLFYAGDGYAVLRRLDNNPIFIFRDRDGGTLLTDPDTDGDYARIANVVRAEGMTNESGDNPYYEAMVSESSAIHPSRLRRGGKPFYMGAVVIRESIFTEGDAKSVAKDELADRQQAAYKIGFDALPIYTLEEGDMIGVEAEGFLTSSPLDRFTIDFKPNQPMSVGYQKLIKPARARIRRV
jgi:hypothetical protein